MPTRLRNFVFTLNNPTLSPAQFSDSLKHIPKLSYFVFQLEEGENDTKRYHGYVELTTQIALPQLASLYSWCIQPKKVTSQQALDRCLNPNTRTDGPWSHGVISTQGNRSEIEEAAGMIASGDSMTEVANRHPGVFVKYHQGLQALKRLKQEQQQRGMCKTMLRQYDSIIWTGWQKKVLDLVELKPDPRAIYWFLDRIGNSGKSFVSKYLLLKYPHDCIVFESASSADIAYLINHQRIVIFDYTRAQESIINYGVIESIKNGRVFSTKCVPVNKIFPPPHVICFSNFYPKKGAFSNDRIRLEVM